MQWLAAVQSGTQIRTRHWPYPCGWGQKNNGSVLDGDGRYAGFARDMRVDLGSEDKVVVLSSIQSAVVDNIAGDLFGSLHGGALVPAPVRRAVALSSNDANAYAGVYRLSADFAVTVKAFGSELQIAGGDGVFEALDPLGSDGFYFRVLDAALVFKRAANGAMAAIDWGPGISRWRESRPALSRNVPLLGIHRIPEHVACKALHAIGHSVEIDLVVQRYDRKFFINQMLHRAEVIEAP